MATERSPLPWQPRRPPPKGRGRLITVATREMGSRGCRRGNREELGMGGVVAMVTAGGGLVIPAAQLPCDMDPSSNGSGVLQVGAQNICGWRCKMAVGTADTPEMQSEQLGTGGLRGHVMHLAVPFSHLIPCQRKGRHLL